MYCFYPEHVVSKIKEIFRRKQKDVWTRREKAWWLAQRMLDQATMSLTEAIGEGDMLGVRVASELGLQVS